MGVEKFFMAFNLEAVRYVIPFSVLCVRDTLLPFEEIRICHVALDCFPVIFTRLL